MTALIGFEDWISSAKDSFSSDFLPVFYRILEITGIALGCMLLLWIVYKAVRLVVGINGKKKK